MKTLDQVAEQLAAQVEQEDGSLNLVDTDADDILGCIEAQRSTEHKALQSIKAAVGAPRSK